jgi:hypothetical protein
MPRWDGLKPLPDHVLAPLLRALACIPRTADMRLLLRKVESDRPPGKDPVMTLRLPAEVIEHLGEWAKEAGISRSRVARIMIENGLIRRPPKGLK